MVNDLDAVCNGGHVPKDCFQAGNAVGIHGGHVRGVRIVTACYLHREHRQHLDPIGRLAGHGDGIVVLCRLQRFQLSIEVIVDLRHRSGDRHNARLPAFVGKRMPKGDATIAATRIIVSISTSTTAPPPAATMELAADAIPLPIVCTACTIAPPIFFAPLPPFFADVWSIVCCALRCAAALARRVMIALFGVAWSVGRTRMVRAALVMACLLLGAGPPLTDAP